MHFSAYTLSGFPLPSEQSYPPTPLPGCACQRVTELAWPALLRLCTPAIQTSQAAAGLSIDPDSQPQCLFHLVLSFWSTLAPLSSLSTSNISVTLS